MQISRNYHDWCRQYALAHGNEIRPVVLNSWEGTYFKFDEKKVKRMIDAAADFGIEMFVLDDGWFGTRNDDSASSRPLHNAGIVFDEQAITSGASVFAGLALRYLH